MSDAIEQSLSGKVCIVTGVNVGIGKEIALGLAARGADLVLAVRDVTGGELAQAAIVKAGHNLDVEVMQLDLSDLANVRDFAHRFRKHHPQLHLWINNAAGEVLGSWLLARELLEPLRAGAPSRIVNVVSAAAARDQRLLTGALAKRLEGTGVTVNAVDPGLLRLDPERDARGHVKRRAPLLSRLLGKSPEAGAETVLWVATGPELAGVTGMLFAGPRARPLELRDPARLQALERLCTERLASLDGAQDGAQP